MGVSCYYCSKPCQKEGAGFSSFQCIENYRIHYQANSEAGVQIERVYHDEIPEGWETLKEFSQFMNLVKTTLELGMKKGWWNDCIHYVKPSEFDKRRNVEVILPPEQQKNIIAYYEAKEDKKYEELHQAENFRKSALRIPANVEELRKAHPLVRNDHFFNTEYFPNVELESID